MITRVGEFNTKGVANSLRQSTRPMSFMYSYDSPMPYDYVQKSNQSDSQPGSQQSGKSPIWTGTSIVLGSVLFMILYFLISGSKRG